MKCLIDNISKEKEPIQMEIVAEMFETIPVIKLKMVKMQYGFSLIPHNPFKFSIIENKIYYKNKEVFDVDETLILLIDTALKGKAFFDFEELQSIAENIIYPLQKELEIQMPPNVALPKAVFPVLDVRLSKSGVLAARLTYEGKSHYSGFLPQYNIRNQQFFNDTLPLYFPFYCKERDCYFTHSTDKIIPTITKIKKANWPCTLLCNIPFFEQAISPIAFIPFDGAVLIKPHCDIALLLNARKNGGYIDDGEVFSFQNRSCREFFDFWDAHKHFINDNNCVPSHIGVFLSNVLKRSTNLDVNTSAFDALFVSNETFVLPRLNNEYYFEYQKQGIEWMYFLAKNKLGGLLADDMGLGKTLQILTLITLLKANRPSLVVCPSTLVKNWEQEGRHFFPQMKVLCIGGGKSKRKEIIKNIVHVDLAIISYDLLKCEIELLKEINFALCVADEAQYIKNYNSLASKAIRQINAACRFAVSGTPVENNLSELWSIFQFISPGFLGRYLWFRSKYVEPIEKRNDERKLSVLRNAVAPFILHRRKEDILSDLPTKSIENISIEMDSIQKFYYQSQRKDLCSFLQKVKDEETITPKMKMKKLLPSLMRMRQICCHPPLCIENYRGTSPKLMTCISLVRNAVALGHRVLIFSQFATMLNVIAKELSITNISWYLLTGKTPKEERVSMVADFNKNTIPVFLLSLKAGGTGLNLTGADVAIHYDPWWNSSAQNQATDRLYRIGQKKPVTVYNLICKNSIEERIQEIQANKNRLFEGIFQEGDVSLCKMSAAELLQIIDDNQ